MELNEKIELIKSIEDITAKRELIQELVEFEEISSVIIDILVENLSDKDQGLRDICSLGLLQMPEAKKCEAAHKVVKYIETNDIVNRNLAGDILMKYENCAIKALIPYLSDNDRDIRKYALDIIGINGNADQLDMMYQMLDDPDPNVRASTAEAIGNVCTRLEIGDNNSEIASATLIEYYGLEEDNKLYIIEALSKIDLPGNEDFIIDKMNSEDDVFMKIACIDALALHGSNIELCYKLLEELEKSSKMIQPIILKTINAIAYRLEEKIDYPKYLRYVAHNAIGDDNPDIQGAGLLALGNEILTEDLNVLIQRYPTFEYETKIYLLQILIFNSSDIVLIEFINKFFKINFAGQVNLEIEVLNIIASFIEDIPSEKLGVIFSEFIKNIIDCSKGYSTEIIEFLINYNRELVVTNLIDCLDIFETDDDFYEILDVIQNLQIIEMKDILKLKEFDNDDINTKKLQIIEIL